MITNARVRRFSSSLRVELWEFEEPFGIYKAQPTMLLALR